MNDVLISPGPAEEYGEWGCHHCLPGIAGERDLGHESAERGAREHIEATGHSVFIVKGTAQGLFPMHTEPEHIQETLL